MDTPSPKPYTLIGAALAPLDLARSFGLVFGFSLLTAAAAQLKIPMFPVPITGQTFAVLLTGALLGSRLGAMAMIAYLIEGASGLPFFYGGHGGIRRPLGPTGGPAVGVPATRFTARASPAHGLEQRLLSP